MVNIDYIMELLDCDNSKEEQLLGIKLARNIEIIEAFLQPGPPYGKRVWENCAEILSEKTDEELATCLTGLMEWLQDMNWPGSFCILDRLKKFEKNPAFYQAFDDCLKRAEVLGDDIWKENLQEIYGNLQ